VQCCQRRLLPVQTELLTHSGVVHAVFFLLQLFAQFDLKRNNIIDFGEFVRSLSVFHPKAPLEEKAECEHASRQRMV
jgi:hypothetical protein